MNPRGDSTLYIDEIHRGSNLTGPNAAARLQIELEQRLSRGSGPFTVDFSGILTVDNEAVQVLVSASRLARKKNRTLMLSHPPLSLLERITAGGNGGQFGLASETLGEMKSVFAMLPEVKRGQPIVVPASLSAIQVIRDVVVQLAWEMGFSEAAIADIELCVGEATVNAVRYGSPNGIHDRLTVRFFEENDTLVIEIQDNGPGFELHRVPEPHAEKLRENGLGIFLMQSLVDRVEFRHNGGTTVRLEKHLTSGSATTSVSCPLEISIRSVL
jgi:serine/threonine-protein kinase RsbW